MTGALTCAIFSNGNSGIIRPGSLGGHSEREVQKYKCKGSDACLSAAVFVVEPGFGGS